MYIIDYSFIKIWLKAYYISNLINTNDLAN
jgi:hypothetical protein